MRHEDIRARLESLLEGEDDLIAAMATVACELHHAFDHFDWTGFYRLVRPDELVIGPYQGQHGCLRITLDRGVCGASARERRTLRVDDVHSFPDHIACSATTRSELVVPILTPAGEVLGVLDIDSDAPAAFDDADQALCEWVCRRLGVDFAGGQPHGDSHA